MPVIRSAKKKLRVDIKRRSANKKVESLMESTIKKAEKKPTAQSIQNAFKIVDKSAKKNIIHKNKASRIKSRLSKLVAKKPQTPSPKTAKKSKK